MHRRSCASRMSERTSPQPSAALGGAGQARRGRGARGCASRSRSARARPRPRRGRGRRARAAGARGAGARAAGRRRRAGCAARRGARGSRRGRRRDRRSRQRGPSSTAVGPHPRALVQAAVAGEQVQPGRSSKHARVALQGAVRAPQRPLQHVLDLVGRDVVQHPPREALERAAGGIDRVPGAGGTGAQAADETPRSRADLLGRDPAARAVVEAHQRPRLGARGADHAQSYCGRYR